ncbi:MAG: glycosyltransferase [Burkholderiaceae bacterium]
MAQPTVDLVYFNAGSGHRAAAQALRDTIALQGRPWNVRLVNLFEVLDPQGSFRRLTGVAPEDLYNKRLAKGWTLGLKQELKLLQGMIRLGHASLVKTLQQHWAATEPDLVVSLVPNFNRAMAEALAGALPGVPYATVLTDMADHPPHFWIEPGPPPPGHQHIVCGTAHARDQALAAGHAPGRVSLVSGMVLRPAFHDLAPLAGADRDAALRALGLDPARPTGLVMFGGQGSAQMAAIARALAGRQLVLLCGHNEALARRLRRQRPAAAHAVLGFTPDVGRLMRLCDYFIGKPGPGALSEAVQMGLPVITTLNAWTMPQERYNARWVREQGLGLVLPSLRGVAAGVDELLARQGELRAAGARVRNRAAPEVVDLLAQWLPAQGLPAASSSGLGAAGAAVLAAK